MPEQIIWIGGVPEAGKSTLARDLSARHNIGHFECDLVHNYLLDLLSKAQPEVRELVRKLGEERAALSPEARLDVLFSLYDRQWPWFAKIMEMAAGEVLIIDGCALLPKFVPNAPDNVSAIFLVPTDNFKRHALRAKGKSSGDIERDAIFRDRVRRDAEARGFTVLENDGSLDRNSVVARVGDHFTPQLRHILGF